MKLPLALCFCLVFTFTSASRSIHEFHADLCALNPLLESIFDSTCADQNVSFSWLSSLHNSPVKPQAVLESSPRHDIEAQLSWSRQPRCIRHTNETANFCVYTSQDFASSRGISFFVNEVRSTRLLQLVGHNEPEVLQGVNVVSDSRFESKTIPGKGIGLVAKEAISRGDELFRSTPVLIIEEQVYEELEEGDLFGLYNLAVDQLPRPASNLFHDLAGHFGGEPVNDKINTNCFSVQLPIGEDDEDVTAIAIFPEMSRMNHACRPNAHYHFDAETLTQHVHALRTILPGEEITISYIDPAQTSVARQDSLRTSWGFACTCKACSAQKPIREASDRRVHEIKHLTAMLQDHSASSPITDSKVGIQIANLLLELYRLEGMLGPIAEAYAWSAIEYNSARMEWDAVRFANMAIEAGLLYGGPKDPDVLSMMALMDAPRRHWSWDHRARTRRAFEQENLS